MRSNRTSPIGVSILGHAVQAVQYDRRGNGWALRDAVSMPRDNAAAAFTADEAHRLADIFRRRRFVGSDVVAAVPNTDLIRGLIEVKPDHDSPLLAAALEVERTNGLASDTYELAAWPPELPQGSRQCAVMVNGCTHDAAHHLLDTFAQAGLELISLDSRAGSVARSVDTGQGFAGDHITAVLDIDRHATELVLVRRGVVVYQRSLIDAGLRHALNTLNEHGLDDNLAQHLLHQTPIDDEHDLNAAALSAALESFTQMLCTEADPALDYAARLYAPNVIKRLAVVGEGARVSGLEDLLMQRLSLASCSTRRPDLTGLQDDRRFAVESGLAVAPAQGTINLLPEDELSRRVEKRKARCGVLVTSAYAVLLLAGGAGYLAASAPDRAMAATDQLAIETSHVTQLTKSITAIEHEVTAAARQLEATRVLSERPNWSTLLDLVAQAAAGDVVLDAIRVSTTGATIDAGATVVLSGITNDPWQVSTFVLSLEHLGLFDRVVITDSKRAVRGANTLTAFTISAQIFADDARDTP